MSASRRGRTPSIPTGSQVRGSEVMEGKRTGWPSRMATRRPSLGPRLGRRVAIEVGQPVRFPSMTSLPLTWEPVGLEGVLPRVEANIELGSLGEDRTQLAISARYRPPLGVLGQTVDRVLLHRVAEATVKDFLDRVAGAITDHTEADDEQHLAGRTGGMDRDAT